MRQSKTLCSNRRNLFLESEDYTSQMEKSLAREMCIKFKSEEISTTGEDCSRSNSKEKEVWSFALRVGQPIRRKTWLPSFRKRCDRRHYN